MQIKQFDAIKQRASVISNLLGVNQEPLPPYSQTNIVSTNINLISTEGKNRDPKIDNIETLTNKDNLERFGDIAATLHPLVFGDELVKLLKIIINFCITHKHTPQKPAETATKEETIREISEYLSDEKIQELLSKNVRTN